MPRSRSWPGSACGAIRSPDGVGHRTSPRSAGFWPVSTLTPWTTPSAGGSSRPGASQTRAGGRAAGQAGTGRRVYSVDGKTLRGSGSAGAQVHLLAVLDQHTGTVLGQVNVTGKTNELTRFRPLLDPLDLTGVVVTADALHTQREHARWLTEDKPAR